MLSFLRRALLAPPLLRFAALFFFSAILLAGLSGKRRWTYSSQRHFEELAKDYCAGRWWHRGTPPGYCSQEQRRAKKCRGHRFDDWAYFETLRLGAPEAALLDVAGSNPIEVKARRVGNSYRPVKGGPRYQKWWVAGHGFVDFPRDPYSYPQRERKEAPSAEEATATQEEHPGLRPTRAQGAKLGVNLGGTWFVSFPPGPVLFYLPFAYLGRLAPPDIPLTWLLTALVAPLLDRSWQLLQQRHAPNKPKSPHSAFISPGLALAAVFATPLVSIAVQGQVWFLAQLSFVFAACLSLWIYAALSSKQSSRYAIRLAPLAAGVASAWALSCRPTAGFGLSLALGLLIAGDAPAKSPAGKFQDQGTNPDNLRPGFSLRRFLIFAAPILLTALGLALFNTLRFSDPLEFGHRFLQVRWSERILEQGLFSFDYFLRNLSAWLWLWPRAVTGETLPRVSIHGLGWLWSCPWILLATIVATTFAKSHARMLRKPDPASQCIWAFLFGTMVILIPALLYQNSGQLQWSYRFAVDALPLWITALWWFYPRFRYPSALWAAILLALVVNLYGTWMWRHRPAQLFVYDPLGWPFQAEFSAKRSENSPG